MGAGIEPATWGEPQGLFPGWPTPPHVWPAPKNRPDAQRTDARRTEYASTVSGARIARATSMLSVTAGRGVFPPLASQSLASCCCSTLRTAAGSVGPAAASRNEVPATSRVTPKDCRGPITQTTAAALVLPRPRGRERLAITLPAVPARRQLDPRNTPATSWGGLQSRPRSYRPR